MSANADNLPTEQFFLPNPLEAQELRCIERKEAPALFLYHGHGQQTLVRIPRCDSCVPN